MSEEQSEQVEETPIETDEVIETTGESETPTEDTPKEEPKKDNKVQERINKITADKWSEKRRADELQRQLDSINAAVPAQTTEALVMPKEADFDFDTDKYNAKMAEYHAGVAAKAANEAIAKNNQLNQERAANQKADEIYNDFDRKVAASNIEDFYQKTANLPMFSDEVRNVMMGVDNAPELVHYLSEHLDVADGIAHLDATSAAVKIGQISASMANNISTNKISNTPEPIDTINQSGAAAKDEWDGIGGEASFE